MLRGPDGGGPIPVDYSAALEYGNIEFVTVHDMPMYAQSMVQKAWDEDVQRFINRFDPTKDYIIPTGQPMAILCVGFALGVVSKKPRFLVWRREENRYRVVHFDTTFRTPD